MPLQFVERPQLSGETPMANNYDAVLVLSFGGPECREDVLPFLENVLRGKNVPRERMLEVAEHYYHFGGVSPINAQNRELIAALKEVLDRQGPKLPVYWGNRNWAPFLTDTLRQMKSDGVKRALAFVTSVFGSYSGCRQYREDIERAVQEIGEGTIAVDKLRCPFNHPGFIAAMAERVQTATRQLTARVSGKLRLVFTAHSVPIAMARTSPYEAQLHEACRLVSEAAGHSDWCLVYQSRSGPPTQPWLEPDVCAYLRDVHSQGEVAGIVLAPIGFISDHMEVIYDLDTEARQLCDLLAMPMVRAATVGTHPQFIEMVRNLIVERVENGPRLTLGAMPPTADVCPADCCAVVRGRPTATA
jgi:ferrochelatase